MNKEFNDMDWITADRNKDIVIGNIIRYRNNIDKDWNVKIIDDIFAGSKIFRYNEFIESPVFSFNALAKIYKSNIITTESYGSVKELTTKDFKVIFHNDTNITITALNGVTNRSVICNIGVNKVTISWFISILNFLKWNH